jgi:N-acetylmuramic acid 6-phosphate etherase
MIKLGKVYGNLMVDLTPASNKLEERAKGIIGLLGEIDYEHAAKVYQQSGKNVKVGVVMAKMGLSKKDAEDTLARADGFLKRALGER